MHGCMLVHVRIGPHSDLFEKLLTLAINSKMSRLIS